MTASDTPTPRTDALWSALMKACKKASISPANANDAFLELDNWRSLERDLAAAQAELEKWRNWKPDDEHIAEWTVQAKTSLTAAHLLAEAYRTALTRERAAREAVENFTGVTYHDVQDALQRAAARTGGNDR